MNQFGKGFVFGDTPVVDNCEVRCALEPSMLKQTILFKIVKQADVGGFISSFSLNYFIWCRHTVVIKFSKSAFIRTTMEDNMFFTLCLHTESVACRSLYQGLALLFCQIPLYCLQKLSNLLTVTGCITSGQLLSDETLLQ